MNSPTRRSAKKTLILAALLLPAIYGSPGFAQESAPATADDIAKKLANPIA